LVWPEDYQEAEANRNLIAAAPEMLKVLRVVLKDEEVECNVELREMIESVIRKAKGEKA
jgi:hypothetical protein